MNLISKTSWISSSGASPYCVRIASGQLNRPCTSLTPNPFISFYDKGHKEGYEQGKTLGHIEGHVLGREKGFELWEELGFYEGFADVWEQIFQRHKDNDK